MELQQIKEKRTATLYLYIKPSTKTWLEKRAEKFGLSTSHYVDLLVAEEMNRASKKSRPSKN